MTILKGLEQDNLVCLTLADSSGGRQLDGSRAPFDQLAEIVDAVGDRIDVICDGGIRRGSHVLNALALGAKACSGGRAYLYALAGAGQPGVERPSMTSGAQCRLYRLRPDR